MRKWRLKGGQGLPWASQWVRGKTQDCNWAQPMGILLFVFYFLIYKQNQNKMKGNWRKTHASTKETHMCGPAWLQAYYINIPIQFPSQPYKKLLFSFYGQGNQLKRGFRTRSKLGRGGTGHLPNLGVSDSRSLWCHPSTITCFTHWSQFHRIVIIVMLSMGRSLSVSHTGGHSAFPDISRMGSYLLT